MLSIQVPGDLKAQENRCFATVPARRGNNYTGALSLAPDQLEEGLVWLDRALAQAEAAGDPALLASVWSNRGDALCSTGRPPEARQAFGRGLELREHLLSAEHEYLLLVRADWRK